MTTLQATVTDGNGNPLAMRRWHSRYRQMWAQASLSDRRFRHYRHQRQGWSYTERYKSGTYPVTVSVNNYGVSDTKRWRWLPMLVPQNWLVLPHHQLIHREHNRGRDPDGKRHWRFGNPLEGIMVNFRGSATLSNTASKRMLRVRQKFLWPAPLQNESNYS